MYNEEDGLDEEIEGHRTFDVHEKLESNRYNAGLIHEMKGEGVMLCFVILGLPSILKSETILFTSLWNKI